MTMSEFEFTLSTDTIGPGDYDSFAMAILS